jgi:ubiquinone/menaquinone biosynthesis C-methylase UbiE
VPRLIGSAKGVVLELGPGSGNQIPRFRSSAIGKAYAVEPNAQFILILVQRAKDHGLDEKYTVINAALENQDVLTAHGIVDGSVDTVVCMQVLCSVSDAKAAARGIWRLLRPGGQLVYWEHQCSRDGVTRWVQSEYLYCAFLMTDGERRSLESGQNAIDGWVLS